jgi:proteasome accessory factor C
VVEKVIGDLRAAINGRDAFFPAAAPPSAELIRDVELAIAEGGVLAIAYQSLAAQAPGWRQVAPLRLEESGALYYLHAYCHLAEANRIFRLDRIDAWEVVGEGNNGFE